MSRPAAEDRCHLNGLALEDGKCRYVSAVSMSDVIDGWRDRRRDGGVVLEAPDEKSRRLRGTVDAAFAALLPRRVVGAEFRQRRYLGKIKDGKFERVAFCPGYLRGLAFVGDYAVVGMSRPRHDKTFGGLALDEELARRRGLEDRVAAWR